MGYDVNRLLDDLPALMLQHNAQKEQARQFNADYNMRRDLFDRQKQREMNLADLMKQNIDQRQRDYDFDTKTRPELKKQMKADNWRAVFESLSPAPRKSTFTWDIDKAVNKARPDKVAPDFTGIDHIDPTTYQFIQQGFPYFNSNDGLLGLLEGGR